MKKLLSIMLSLLLFAAPAYATCSLWSGNTYTCLSSDTKPSATNGSRLYETDTRKEYLRAAGVWEAVTDPAKQVTGGDTHDHTLGAGAQISHYDLDPIGLGTNAHDEIDTSIIRVNWLDQADTDRFCSGVVEGGTITPTTGNLFTIAAGDGYINNHIDTKSHVVWTEKTSVATVGDGTNYIAINADGSANVSLTKQDQGTHVRLGHVYAASGNTVILETWNVPDWAIHLQGRLNDFIGEGIGVLVAGTAVSEKTTPNFLELNIASGTMRARLGTFTVGTTSTFTSMYHTSDYDWVPDTSTPNHVNTTQYNNYSGTYGGTALVTMIDTYWKKDLILRTPSTGNVYYIMAQTQYATEDEAKSAPMPTLPPSVAEDSAMISTVVSQKGETTIASGLYDVRPNMDRVFGHGTGAGASATDHATLVHLDFTSSGHYGTVDGDWLPGLSVTKKGGVPATGTPSGKYLKDDGTWATVSGGGYATIQEDGTPLTQRTILNFSGTGATCADDTTRTTCTINTGGVDLAAEPFTTYSTSTNLSAERVWTNGTNTTIDVGTAGQIKINVPAIPTDISGASYWTKVAETSLSNEIAFGTLGSGLILNTTTTGVPTIYAGTFCTNQFPRSLNASGAATCASIVNADLPAIDISKGGTTQTASTEDAVLVGSGTVAWVAKVLPSCSNATTSKLLYDTATNTFSCGTDQTAGGGPQTAKLTADYTNSTTTGTNVSGLNLTLAAGTYRYSYWLAAQIATIANAFDFGVNFTGTQTLLIANLTYQDTGVSTSNGIIDDVITGDGGETVIAGCVNTAVSTTVPNLNCITSSATAGTNNFVKIEGMIVVTVSGTLQLYGASESTTAITVKAGSTVIAQPF